SRLAIVLRMFDSGTSVPGVIEGPAGAGRGAGVDAGRIDGAAAAAGRGPAQDSMSRLMMRPPGPLPATAERSMLRSAAMLRASGLAFTRPPSPLPLGGQGSPRGAADGGGAGAGAVWAADATEAA